MKKASVLFLGVLFTVTVAGAAGLGPMASSMKVGTTSDVATQKLAVQQLHGRLMAQQVAVGVKRSIVVELDDQQRKSLRSESRWPLQVGVVAPVSATISFPGTNPAMVNDKAMVQPYGALRRHGDEMVWSTAVIAHGATGIRLMITGLDLPKDGELAIYNRRGEAFSYSRKGPASNGTFWTNTVTGDTAYLQLSGADITKVSFEIADLGYLGDAWVVGAHSGLEKSFCSYNANCVENAGCGIDNAASDATKGVAHMQYVKRPYLYVCSGGLLANDAGKPYFLTANHCISRDREAGTLEAYFFYEIGCHDSCPEQWSQPDTPRTLGASVVKTNKTSDYTLLELAEPAPVGSVLMGWDATDIAFADGTDLYRISHPAAAPQAYSTHVVDTSYGTCTSWPRGNWIYSRDTYGATEGGSSGSPVVNSAGQVVGQLSGGCGTNINDTCDWESNATVDGAFAAYYNEIASYLGGGCTPVPEICDDGIDNDCDNLVDGDDPDCGGCVPEPEDCNDGIDNDCDLLVDGDDPDCGTCQPYKAPCSVDADCCSNNCGGKPGAKTCKK